MKDISKLKRVEGTGKVIFMHSGIKNKSGGSVAVRAVDQNRAMKVDSGEIKQFCEMCSKDLSPEDEYVFLSVPSENYIPAGRENDKNLKILPSAFLCNKCMNDVLNSKQKIVIKIER